MTLSARKAEGSAELPLRVLARDDRAAAAGAAGVAGPATRRIHRSGHVSTVVGARPFEFLPDQYGKPVAISGFEPLDLLQSVLMVLRQSAEGRTEVENQYARVVPWEGNLRALEIMSEVFDVLPHFEWRGLGVHLPERTQDLPTPMRSGMPRSVSRCPAFAWPTRRPVSAGRC